MKMFVKKSHPTVEANRYTWPQLVELAIFQFTQVGNTETVAIPHTGYYYQQLHTICRMEKTYYDSHQPWIVGPFPDNGYLVCEDLSFFDVVTEVESCGTARFVTELSVVDPDTQALCNLAVYKDDQTTALFGVDSAFILTLSDDDPVIEPFNGTSVRLIEPIYDQSPMLLTA